MDPLEDSALEGYIAFHFVPVEGVVIVTIDTGAVKFAGDIGYIEIVSEFFIEDMACLLYTSRCV